MVQAIENRSRVWCSPASAPAPGPAPGWSSLTVRIHRTAAVEGLAHLMAEATGRDYTALVPPTVMDALDGLETWSVEVEVVGPHRIAVRGIVAEDD